MAQEISTLNESLIPPKPIPAQARAFSSRVHDLLDGQPKDDATVSKALEGMDDVFELIAAGLYSMASMLVGEGEESVQLVESAIATAEVSACADAFESRQNSRRALCGLALDILDRRVPGSLAAPEVLEPAGACIEDDDLDAAAAARQDLARMITGPDRDRVRNWLQGLPTVVRTIFVLRAVAGFSAEETVELLAAHGGPQAAGWNAEEVRGYFRQGLCSLASQLVKAEIRD